MFKDDLDLLQIKKCRYVEIVYFRRSLKQLG